MAASWKWSAPRPFEGFADSGLVGLLAGCGVPVDINRLDVLDGPLTTPAFENYFSIPINAIVDHTGAAITDHTGAVITED